MRTFLCFLWIVMSPFLFTESSTQHERRDMNNTIRKTIRLLHELGHKDCPGEVEKAMSDRFTSLPKNEVSQALKISFNYIFELFKKNKTHSHWKNNTLEDLMQHLKQQTTSHLVPGMSSELETLVENFRKLDQFLTQQSFSGCAWETVRQDVLVVMNHFRKMKRRL